MKKLMALLTMVSSFSFFSAQAQNGMADTAALNFIKEASQAGLKEVQAGKLAEKKAQSSDVKAFARRMVSDHTRANEKLIQLETSKGYNVPRPTLSEASPDAMLTGSSGEDFDRNYVKMMVGDHEKAVALFEQAANSLQDQSLKNFARETLPTLRQHLASIRAIASRMKISTGK